MRAEYRPTIKSSDDKIIITDIEMNWHKDDTLRLKPGSIVQFVDTDNRLILITKKDAVDDDTKGIDGDYFAFKFNKKEYNAKVGWENKRPVFDKIQPTTLEKEVVKYFNEKKIPHVCKVIKACFSEGTAETVEDLNSIAAVIRFDETSTPENLIDPAIIAEVKAYSGGYSSKQSAKDVFAEKKECLMTLVSDGKVSSDIKEIAKAFDVSEWEVAKALLS